MTTAIVAASSRPEATCVSAVSNSLNESWAVMTPTAQPSFRSRVADGNPIRKPRRRRARYTSEFCSPAIIARVKCVRWVSVMMVSPLDHTPTQRKNAHSSRHSLKLLAGRSTACPGTRAYAGSVPCASAFPANPRPGRPARTAQPARLISWYRIGFRGDADREFIRKSQRKRIGSQPACDRRRCPPWSG